MSTLLSVPIIRAMIHLNLKLIPYLHHLPQIPSIPTLLYCNSNSLTHASTSAHLLSLRESDSSRRAAALADIEGDRERVRVRGERERVGREARERVEAEKRGREERERERGMRGGGDGGE